MDVEHIFESVRSHSQKAPRQWDMESLETFIVSFEKNSQAANEELARGYGNIIKDIVATIQVRDSILLENDSREQEVLNNIMSNSTLYSMFHKLYILVQKSDRVRSRK